MSRELEAPKLAAPRLTPDSAFARWAAWVAPIGKGLSQHLVLVTAILVLLLHLGNAALVAHFYFTTADRQAEAREAEATLLAEHASRAISGIDLALEGIREQLPFDFATQKTSFTTQMMIYRHMQKLPQIRGILVADESGRIIYDSRHYPTTSNSIADRDYFAAQKEGGNGGLYIGRLLYGRFDGRPFFGLSLPLLDNAGKFLGDVVALTEPAYFSSVYDTHGLEPEVTALLARVDGSILANTAVNRPGASGANGVESVLATNPQHVTLTKQVPLFPLEIVLVGPSPAASPAFRGFLRADIGMMVAVTLVALLLARFLATEVVARARAENRLRDAFESVPASVALYDSDDRLVLCNERYRTNSTDAVRSTIVPGAKFADILAASAASLQETDPGGETAEEYYARRMGSHRAGKGEVVQKLPGGIWALSRDRRTNEGGVVICHTDITQMKQQEEALRRSEQAERMARQQAEKADQAKSAFLATMSHELRTPLNAVIGFSEIIEREMFGPIPARYREYNALILRSGQHLLAVINDILDIAKLQSGKTELHLGPLNLGDMVADCARIMTDQAAATGVTLDCDIEGEAPTIVADTTRMRQVLLNLLSNAIKFTKPGGRVAIVLRQASDGIRIIVSDTGIGMSARDIPKALEPFGQIDNSMTRTREGTGLGLPLAKNLVELHGGRFQIESTPNVGTTVTIILPASPANDTPHYDALPVRQRSIA